MDEKADFQFLIAVAASLQQVLRNAPGTLRLEDFEDLLAMNVAGIVSRETMEEVARLHVEFVAFLEQTRLDHP